MNILVLCCPNQHEQALILPIARFLLQRRGYFQSPVCLRSIVELERYLEKPELPQVLICDVTLGRILPLLEQLRAKSRQMKLVLLADGSVCPSQYIRPSILPTALLWRPVNQTQVKGQLKDVFSMIEVGSQETGQPDYFTIEMRGAVRQFPYAQILYFEARDKRLYLHLRRKEIPFPGTLEKLTQTLPDCFLRIHKSFIVNRMQITEVQFGQNEIKLESGDLLPISRSYKAAVRAVFT